MLSNSKLQTPNSELKALILCGGKSSRMGTDKGSLKLEDRTWAELAYSKALKMVDDVYVSVNEKQRETYHDLFIDQQCIADAEIAIEGPLKGILSAHKAFPEADWLVLACDMIYLEEWQLNSLIQSYQENAGSEYYLFSKEEDQPFPAIYSAKALMKIYNDFNSGELANWSLKRNFDRGVCYRIPYEGIKNKPFLNINTALDLEKTGSVDD